MVNANSLVTGSGWVYYGILKARQETNSHGNWENCNKRRHWCTAHVHDTYHSVLPPLCEFVKGGIFLTSLLAEGKVKKNLLVGWVGGEKKRGDIFSYYFGVGNWNFYDPKKETCKINYFENKVKLNNKDNSKNNDNEIKEIISPKYIILISSKVQQFFAARIYLLKLINKNSRARCAIWLKITNKDTRKT